MVRRGTVVKLRRVDTLQPTPTSPDLGDRAVTPTQKRGHGNTPRPLDHIERSWLRGRDLNPRPLGYEPNELPDCSTPRHFRL